MTIAKRLRQEITQYTPADRPGLVEFQREAFGPHARQSDEDHFGWLFGSNPFRPADGYPIWLCKKGREVVGQQAGIPFDLKAGRRCFRASWAVDLRVNPQWHLRGVGPTLSEIHVARNQITCSLGVTSSAQRMYLRSGWMDLGSVPLYVRPLDVSRMLSGRGIEHRIAHLAGKAAEPLVRLADAAWGAYVRRGGYMMRPVARFDERVDALWAEVCGRYPAIARRDLSSRRWRFDACPLRQRYHKLYLLEGDRLRGYAVARLEVAHGSLAGTIVDYLSAPEWLMPLFAGCVEYLRSTGAAAVRCATLNCRAGRRLHALGFVKRKNESRFMVRLRQTDPFLSELVGDARNWFLTMADGDMDLACVPETESCCNESPLEHRVTGENLRPWRGTGQSRS